MIYVLNTTREYDDDEMDKIIYVSKSLNNIYNFLKDNSCEGNEKLKLKKYKIDNFEINPESFEKYRYNKNTLYVDIKKGIIKDKDDKIVHTLNNTNSKYNDLLLEKQKYIIKCEELWRKKSIPNLIDNYFHIIYQIKNADNNLEEDIDYLMSVLLELETYPDKEKN
jgi:hypothetical protein